MSQHTPGPWAIGLETGDDQAQIIDADGGHVATVAIEPLMPTARLIAAAPDLLAALDGLLEYLSEYDADYPEAALLFDNARAVLAKAIGEAA